MAQIPPGHWDHPSKSPKTENSAVPMETAAREMPQLPKSLERERSKGGSGLEAQRIPKGLLNISSIDRNSRENTSQNTGPSWNSQIDSFSRAPGFSEGWTGALDWDLVPSLKAAPQNPGPAPTIPGRLSRCSLPVSSGICRIYFPKRLFLSHSVDFNPLFPTGAWQPPSYYGSPPSRSQILQTFLQ